MSESLLSEILDSIPEPSSIVPGGDILDVPSPVVEETLEATREDWLERAIECVRPWFADAEAPLPERVRVSVGIPASASGRGRMSATGQTWAAAATADGVFQVFISPMVDEVHGGDGVLSTLLHELVHCAVGLECGHRNDFKAVAIKIGLEGKMPASVPSAPLAETFKAMADALGPYPHRKLDVTLLQGADVPDGKGGKVVAPQTTTLSKPQRNRWVAVQCPGCGAKARASRTTLARVTFYCDCGSDARNAMVEVA